MRVCVDLSVCGMYECMCECEWCVCVCVCVLKRHGGRKPHGSRRAVVGGARLQCLIVVLSQSGVPLEDPEPGEIGSYSIIVRFGSSQMWKICFLSFSPGLLLAVFVLETNTYLKNMRFCTQ